MSSETPLGYPYVEGPDAIGDMPTTSQGLANKLDDEVGLIDVGTGTIDIVSAGVQATATITFAAGRFTSTPKVVATPNISGSGVLTCTVLGVSGVSTSGATVTGARTSGTSDIDFTWIAVQQ